LERIQREYSPAYFSKTLEHIFQVTMNDSAARESLTSAIKSRV
jgi:hypothetical protein